MTSSADPVDPPVPVPNVPGADAGVHGLPDRSELSLGQRLIVDASAAADIGLRTVVAAVFLAAVVAPVRGVDFVAGDVAADRGRADPPLRLDRRARQDAFLRGVGRRARPGQVVSRSYRGA